MNSYGIYIDRDMVQNVFETNPAEAFELFNLKLLAYLLGWECCRRRCCGVPRSATPACRVHCCNDLAWCCCHWG